MNRNIEDALAACYFQKRDERKKHHNRVDPFIETVVDRWEKAKFLNFGVNTSIYDSAMVWGDVHVGDNVWIGPYVMLDGYHARLRIGSWCSISAHVQIYTHNTVARAVTGGKANFAGAPVEIGSCVYVGPASIISMGVTVGNHVIIGANSFVDKSLPDFSVAWGQPAKIVGKIEMNAKGDDYIVRYLDGASS